MKAILVLILAATSFAQEGFIVEGNARQKWPADEVQKV